MRVNFGVVVFIFSSDSDAEFIEAEISKNVINPDLDKVARDLHYNFC